MLCAMGWMTEHALMTLSQHVTAVYSDVNKGVWRDMIIAHLVTV